MTNLKGDVASFLLIVLGLLSVSAGAQVRAPVPSVDDLYAEAIAAKRAGDLTTAIARYNAILVLDPKLAAAHNNLGLLFFQSNEYLLAIQSFEAGLRVDPKMTSSLVPLGTAYFLVGQFAKARDLLDRASRLNPSDEAAQLYHGRALFSLGQLEVGAAVVQKLLRKSPRNVEALYTLGQMYMKLAQGTLRELEVQAPDSYLTNLISGQVQESTENYDGALDQYRKALEKEPKFRGAHYNVGNIYWLEGKWELAIKELKLELIADPYNCLAQWKIANSLLNLSQDRDEAIGRVTKALEICPNLAQAHLDFGRLLAAKGDLQQAVAQYRLVVTMNPEESSVHVLLVNAYRKLGRATEADAEAKIVREMNARRSARESKP